MTWITNESPNSSFWDYISRFQQSEYVERLYGEFHTGAKIETNKVKMISSAFAQGQMYFESAVNSPIGVAPVLLYYGVVSLASGLALFKDQCLDEKNLPGRHGLKRVKWKELMSDKYYDLLMLGVKAENGIFEKVVDTAIHLHIEVAYVRDIRKLETFPYWHRLGEIKLVRDRTIVTLDDLVSRSRYTGGHYGGSTKRQKRLHRGTVREDGSGLVLSISFEEKEVQEWLINLSKEHGLECKGREVVFPLRNFNLQKADLLPVFHKEKSIGMSIVENFGNGDRLSEFIKLYLMAYILGMLARYHPSHWMDVVRNQAQGADHHLLLHATKAVEENFPREFAGQLAFLTDDPYFFGEHFGESMSMFADDWREIVGVGQFSG